MDLQKFIYQNYNNLIIKDVEGLHILQINDKYDFTDATASEEQKTFKHFISVVRRVTLKDIFLNKISELRCGDGFSHIYKIIKNILRIKLDNDVINFLTVNGLYELFNLLIEKIVKIWENPLLTIESIYDDLVEKARNKRDSGLSYENKHKIIRFYLEFISTYMEKMFTIDFDSVKFLFSTGIYSMNKVPSITFTFNYYSVIIQNKVNNLNYTIIYAIYEFNNRENPKYNGFYTFVFNFIPHLRKDNGQTINSLGLYIAYTSIGIYLCKPLDYIVQVGTVAPSKDYMGSYYFLGDVYHNLFPVKQILEHH
jgi:hypothetical protein